MIAVVDYCKGNLKSVQRGLETVGAQVVVTGDPAEIARAGAIVLPGVGAFADASASMICSGQMPVIRERIRQGVPFLGICLGLHLLFEEGAEGSPAPAEDVSSAEASPAVPSAEDSPRARGLAVLPGVANRIPNRDAAGAFFKVPHVGWDTVDLVPTVSCPLFEGIPTGEHFYFTHSYIAPANECTVATTAYSTTFPCAVQYGNVFGVQFHPEKSSDAGLAVLRNFTTLAAG